MARLTTIPIENVRIADIRVGVRRRKSIGPLSALMHSIQAHGLIHPIVLRNGELVVGRRRLAAFEKLGLTHIPARRVEEMTDEELRAIELDENTERKDLNDFDVSKARLAEIRQAEADVAKAEEVLSKPDKTQKKGGRPTKGKVSRKAIAKVTGISETTQQRIAAHVALAERYPAFRRVGWVQDQVLDAGELLEKLSEPERSKATTLLDQEGIPPKKALGVLENLVSLSTEKRREIFKLAQSDDPHERTTALTRAAALPDPLDPGLIIMGDVVALARKAARNCRHAEFKTRISELADAATEVLKAFTEWNKKERKHD